MSLRDHARTLAPYAAIFALALTLRLLYLGDVAALPDFDTPAVDAAYHDYWARGIVTGEWPVPGGQIVAERPQIAEHPFFRPPGYPYALAGIYKIFGQDPAATRIVQFILGALSCVTLAALGARIFSRTVGLLASAAMATTWTLIYYEGELHPPVLVVALTLLGLLTATAARTRGPGLAALAGLLFGAAALAVPNVAALIPGVAVWLFLTRRTAGTRPAAVAAIALLLGAALAIAPATLRNHAVSGEWVPISTNYGINLYAGNHPGASGHDVDIPEFGTSFDHLRMVRIAEQRAGHPLTHAEASQFWADEAWTYIADHPADSAARVARTARLFWGAAEIFSNKELNAARAESPILSRLPLGFAGILALAAAGVLLVARRKSHPDSVDIRDPAALPLLAWFVLGLFATYLPFFVTARYRLPVVPVLLLFAAAAAVGLVRAARARRWPLAAALALLSLGTWSLSQLASRDISPDPVYWHHLHGVTHARKGELPAARARLDQALAARPDHVPSLHERAKVLRRLELVDAAIADLRAAHTLSPQNADVALDLGVALTARNQQDEALAIYSEALAAHPDHPTLHANRGRLRMLRGDLPGAVDDLQIAARHAVDPSAHLNLGVALAQLGRFDESELALRTAAERGPADPATQHNLCKLLRQLHRQGAVATCERAVALQDTPAERELLAGALAEAGRPAEAIALLTPRLDADPTDLPALAVLIPLYRATNQHGPLLTRLDAAVARAPDCWYCVVELARTLATHPDPARRDPARALELADRAAPILGDQRPEVGQARAAALAALGRFDEAAAAAHAALALPAAADPAVGDPLRAELAAYTASATP